MKYNPKNKIMLELENPIAFYPQIARKLGGINEAVFVQQLYYWQNRAKREDGFIYKTQKEWEEETTLSRNQQDRVRKKLVRLRILEIKKIKANGAPTLHYKLNIDLLQEILQNQQLDLLETSKSNCGKPANPILDVLTENTTEIKDTKVSLANAKNDSPLVGSSPQGFGGESPKNDSGGGLDKNEDLLPKQIQEIMSLFYGINPALNFANKTSRGAAEWMIKKWGIEVVRDMTKKVIECQSQEFAPEASTPYEMKEKLIKFKNYFTKRANNNKAYEI